MDNITIASKDYGKWRSVPGFDPEKLHASERGYVRVAGARGKWGLPDMGTRAHRDKATCFGVSYHSNMLTMSHYKYRQRLQWASTRYAGRHVLVTEEPGTSKTCTLCGHWHAALGSADVFQCPKCDLCIGRDLNGAIGNFYAAYGRGG